MSRSSFWTGSVALFTQLQMEPIVQAAVQMIRPQLIETLFHPLQGVLQASEQALAP